MACAALPHACVPPRVREMRVVDIYPVRDAISTSYLTVSGDTAMLIDAGSETITPKILAKLDDLKAKLQLIVLTHYHYDHVGAADALRRATGAPVAIHTLDADGLRRGGRLTVKPTPGSGESCCRRSSCTGTGLP